MKRRARTRIQRWRQGSLRFAAATDEHATLRALLPLLRPGERALRGRRPARHLIGRALLRALLTSAGRSPRGPIRFARGRRPRDLASNGRTLALSVSHGAGCVVAVAAAGARAGRRVGIDLEPRGRALSPRLQRRINGDVGRWLRLEATLKCDGRGVAALSQGVAAAKHADAAGGLRLGDRPARRITVRETPLPRRRRYRLAIARSAR